MTSVLVEREKMEKIVDQLPQETFVSTLHLKKYFSLRRGLSEFLRGGSPRYVRAVDDVTLCISLGETFGMVGETGCGKTVFGKVLIRLYNPSSGSVLFKPRKEVLEELLSSSRGNVPQLQGYVDIAALPSKHLRPLRKEMQMIFQDPYGSLDPRFRVRDTLEEALIVHRIAETKEQRMDLALKALEDVKLTPATEFMNCFPHMLSGGQRQRVSLAKALLLRSRFITCDEPVSMIDMSLRAGLLELMKDLKKKYDLTYMFITHDLTVAQNFCDRIGVMYLGRVVETAESGELIDNPLHPYTRGLIAAIPEPNPANRLKFRNIQMKGEIPSAVDIPSGCRFHPRCLERDQHPEIRYAYCSVKDPPLIEVTPEHYVACWIYGGE